MPVLSHHVGQKNGLSKCQEFANAAAILLIFFFKTEILLRL